MMGTSEVTNTKALQKLLEAIDKAKLDMVTGAVKIGEALVGIRGLVPRGEFLDWIQENCGFGKSTAYNYIEVFQTFGNYKRVEYFELSALYVLADCPEAADKAKALATKGNRISHKMAKELVAAADAHVSEDLPVDEVVDDASTSTPTTEDETTSDVNVCDTHILDVAPRTCPNCGGHEFDSDGDCERCWDPPEEQETVSEKQPSFSDKPKLPALSDDALEAIEYPKLFVLRRRAAGWSEDERDAFTAHLAGVMALARAPLEA